jgi:hypothetical protein
MEFFRRRPDADDPVPGLELRPQTGGRWAVEEPGEGVLFSGSLRECEDWLDAAENSRRLSSSRRRMRRKSSRRLKSLGAALAVSAVAFRTLFAMFRRNRPPSQA